MQGCVREPDKHDSKGYLKGNVVVVSWRANDLKKDATLDELFRIAEFYSREGK